MRRRRLKFPILIEIDGVQHLLASRALKVVEQTTEISFPLFSSIGQTFLQWKNQKINSIQCNAIQCNAIQCNTTQYNATQRFLITYQQFDCMLCSFFCGSGIIFDVQTEDVDRLEFNSISIGQMLLFIYLFIIFIYLFVCLR